jgi:hypothetical protein
MSSEQSQVSSELAFSALYFWREKGKFSNPPHFSTHHSSSLSPLLHTPFPHPPHFSTCLLSLPTSFPHPANSPTHPFPHPSRNQGGRKDRPRSKKNVNWYFDITPKNILGKLGGHQSLATVSSLATTSRPFGLATTGLDIENRRKSFLLFPAAETQTAQEGKDDFLLFFSFQNLCELIHL